MLDTTQNDLDLVEFDFQLGIERVDDFLQRLFEITLFIDAVDEGGRDQPVGVAHWREVELPQQMALQAYAARCPAGEIPLVVIVAGQAAGAGLVDVFPGSVDRKLAGNPLAPVAVAVVQAVTAMRGLLVGAFLAAALLGDGVAWPFSGLGHRVGAVEVVSVFFALEHGIGVQRLLDLLLQIEGG